MNKLTDYKTYLLNLKRSIVYYNYLCPLFDYLSENNLEFETLTKEQLAQYFTDKKYQSQSINSVIKSCRDYCRFLKIESHPCFEIKLLEVEKKQRVYMTEDDVKEAIKQIATYNSRLDISKIEVILWLLFFTGIRKGELYGLTRNDFDFENCLIKVYAEKTKEEKLLPFPKKLTEKIQRYFNSEKEEVNAFNLNKGNLEYWFRGIINKYLGKKLSPHKLRHGSAKYLMSKGIPVTTLQKILGHRDIKTTLIYAEADQKQIEKDYREKIG